MVNSAGGLDLMATYFELNKTDRRRVRSASGIKPRRTIVSPDGGINRRLAPPKYCGRSWRLSRFIVGAPVHWLSKMILLLREGIRDPAGILPAAAE